MLRTMLKSKLKGLRVTALNVDYQGSITIDVDWLQKSGILPLEQVHVLNVTNGQRFITYAIEGRPGEVCVNGAAARLVSLGDELIVLAYGQFVGKPYYVPEFYNANMKEEQW